MSTAAEINVAVYAKCTEPPAGTTTLREIIQEIATGKHAEQVAAIRAEADPKRRAALKKKLPAAQLSASKAATGRKVLAHSGLVQIDLDHIGSEAAANLRDKIEYDPHVAAAFISPSGDGLKFIVAIPPELDRHAESFAAAANYVRQNYGHTADPACRDATRLCFLSHDAESWCKTAVPLDVEKWAPKPATGGPEDGDEVEDGGTDEDESKAAPAPPNPKGWVILPSELCGNLESAKTAFAAMRKTKRFYLRGGRACEIQKIDGADPIEILKPARLSSSIENCGVPVAAWGRDRNKKPVLRPGALAFAPITAMWLESAARYDLPTIKSVVTCPPLTTEDGRLVLLPAGYDEPSGTLVLSALVPDQTLDHREALDAIDLMLRDFDFVTPSDRSRALAMLVTPALVAGGLLREHVPLFAVEADKSQTGKGYLCELVQTVYGETASFVGRKEGGVGSLDESLASALVGGRPFIMLDNFRNRLASQFFEMVLTCPRGATVGCRTPHRPEVQIDPSRVIFHCTSNGLEMTEDLANRACVIRIRKRHGWNPPRFPEGGLIEHVAAHRERFLGAVYNLAGTWFDAGCPRTEDSRAPGRFRAWGQSLDWIAQETGGCPPLLDGHEAIQERVANPGLVWLREIGSRILADHPDRLTPWTASNLVELCADYGITIPGTKPDAGEDKAARAVGVVMARALTGQETVQADDILVTREEITVSRGAVGGDKTLKAYRFERFRTNRTNRTNPLRIS